MMKITKNFLFFFSAGILTPLYLSMLSNTGHLSIVLSIDFTIAGFASLYLGKLSDTIGTRKLFLFFIPLSIISVLFLRLLVAQVIYGIALSTIGLLINIETSKQEGKGGINFGMLNFYTQIATALSILFGGLISSIQSIVIYTILMVAYFISRLA